MVEIIELIANKIHQKHYEISEFFAKKIIDKRYNFYNSVDIRHSGYKIAVVDTNSFPAGFNNLVDSNINLAQHQVEKFLSANFANKIIKKIIVIAENHTRNQKYFDNLAVIEKIFSNLVEVKIVSLSPEITYPTAFNLTNLQTLTIYPLQTIDNQLAVDKNFIADVAILNNDLTQAPLEIIQNTITPIMPSVNLGWYNRSKSNHFTFYNQLVEEFCKIIEVDPWLISTYHDQCLDVDFKNNINLDLVAKKVDEILQKTQKKYQQFNIKDKPYVFVKADNGTYGMAVWSVESGQQILEINKKERNKMSVVKGSVINSKVIIQEGIKTIDKINNSPCEPLIYLINGEVVANLFRANNNRNDLNSLNASGAIFYNIDNTDFEKKIFNFSKNSLAVYEIIAKLACCANILENNISN